MILTLAQREAVCKKCNPKFCVEGGLCSKHLEAQEAMTRLETLLMVEKTICFYTGDSRRLREAIESAESQCKELGV